MRIEYINHSLANNMGDHIEMNKNLKKYPYLHDKIMDHELGHSSKNGFTTHDWKHDLNHWDWKFEKELFWFMLKYPKTLFQALPIRKKESTIYINWNLVLIYSVVLLIAGVVRKIW